MVKWNKKNPGKELKKKLLLEPIADPMEFKKNKSSDKARSVTSINERITIDLWFDKHYIDRHQHGDDNGKRDGIDSESVKEIVLRSVKHLLVYSACLPNFTFLNHENYRNKFTSHKDCMSENNR